MESLLAAGVSAASSLVALNIIQKGAYEYILSRLQHAIVKVSDADIMTLSGVAADALPIIASKRESRDASRRPNVVARHLARLFAPFLFFGHDMETVVCRATAFAELSSRLSDIHLPPVEQHARPRALVREECNEVLPLMPAPLAVAFRLLHPSASTGCKMLSMTKDGELTVVFPRNVCEDVGGGIATAFRQLFQGRVQADSCDWLVSRILANVDVLPPFSINHASAAIGSPRPMPDRDDVALFDVPPLNRAQPEEQIAIAQVGNKRPAEEVHEARPAKEARRASPLQPVAVRAFPIEQDDAMLVGRCLAFFQMTKQLLSEQMN